MTLSGLTSVASADPDGDDGPTVGPEGDERFNDISGAGDAEWADFINEFVSHTTENLPTYANPGALSIEECATAGDLEACLSTPTYLYYGSKDCGGIQTPKLYWTSLTASTTTNGVFQVEVEFWIGVNPDTDCVWVGQENAGVCTEIGCNIQEKRRNLDIDPWEYASVIWNLKEWAQDNPDIVTTTGQTVALSATGAAVASAAGGGGISFNALNGMVSNT